jgi:hypothetical protein
LGQRNSAFANCHGLGLPRERKTPLLKATFCPFGSRLNPSLIKIDDKIVTRPLRLPQGRRLPGYERELLYKGCDRAIPNPNRSIKISSCKIKYLLKILSCCTAQDPMPMRLMQVHKQRSGYKPVLPQPFDFFSHARPSGKTLMRTDIK